MALAKLVDFVQCVMGNSCFQMFCFVYCRTLFCKVKNDLFDLCDSLARYFKGLFHPAFLSRVVSLLAFVVAKFSTHEVVLELTFH